MIFRLLQFAPVVPFLAVLMTGCTTKMLNLPASAGLVTNTTVGRDRAVAIRVPFSDEREVQDLCGKGRRLTLLCDQEVAPWLTELLVQELTDWGFDVYTDTSQVGQNTLLIEGALQRFFVSVRVINFVSITSVAEINVKLVARSDSGFERTQSFFAEADSGPEYFRLHTWDYHESTLGALKKIIQAMATAIEEWERNK